MSANVQTQQSSTHDKYASQGKAGYVVRYTSNGPILVKAPKPQPKGLFASLFGK